MCALVLAVIAAANMLVDPYGLYPGIHLDNLRPYESKRGSRVAKGDDLALGGYRTILFGSSRTEVGFDPQHPILSPQPVYNAALSGTSMLELHQLYEFARAHNALTTILFALDFHLFAERRGFGDDYEASRIAGGRPEIIYHFDNLLSHRALTATIDSLKRMLRGAPSNYDEYGFRRTGLAESRKNTMEMSALRLRHFYSAPDLFGDFRLSEARLADFSALVRRESVGNQVIVILIPPVHALLLETIHAAGLWEDFARFKRELAELDDAGVLVFDFTGYNQYTTEPLPIEHPDASMQWYWEPSHFRKELGDLALSIAFSAHWTDPPVLAPTSFGQRLTPEMIEAQLARIDAEREAWLAGAGDQMAWLRRVIGQPRVDE